MTDYKNESRVRFLRELLEQNDKPLAIKALDLVIEVMNADNGYKRDNGIHYYYHCVDVTQTMWNNGFRSDEALAASLLHDYVEDVEGWTIAMIRILFGDRVAQVVDLVTKKPGLNYKDPVVMQAYLDAIEQDLEAAAVKTCDRMHNFSTLLNCTAEKKMKQANETEVFFLPFFKRCRKRYTAHSAFFFQAKTAIEPHLYEIKAHYEEVHRLEQQVTLLNSRLEELSQEREQALETFIEAE